MISIIHWLALFFLLEKHSKYNMKAHIPFYVVTQIATKTPLIVHTLLRLSPIANWSESRNSLLSRSWTQYRQVLSTGHAMYRFYFRLHQIDFVSLPSLSLLFLSLSKLNTPPITYNDGGTKYPEGCQEGCQIRSVNMKWYANFPI